MEFRMNYASFYVIQVDGKGDDLQKQYKHFQTMDYEEYSDSALKDFLDGELKKIVNRKVERHPRSEQVPTKLGHFIVEPGHELDSNPNYNVFRRAQVAQSKEEFYQVSEMFVDAYVDASAIRGGAFLVISATLEKYFDEPFIFLLKCDFEPKVASISDESTLIRSVEMAITTKNMKSIQYPYMPEKGMLEPNELKIHQASHARYFEDFLKFVAYGESMPEIQKTQVKSMVQEHVQETFEEDSEELKQFEEDLEIWEASEKRELKERLTTEQVVEATSQMVEENPEIELNMKIGETTVKGKLADYGEDIHLAKVNGRYVLLIESDFIQFDKGVSPIEFQKPNELQDIMNHIMNKERSY
ncbi:DUF3900 domain-containing protein [Pontibacillus marinus]|uniref:DUF3898 domain-containing protein n=1 Tax=Pontibacillus marinus BH030004 = DSM 16465 TaxID=1385511 RepID=A0A0A5GJR9_9BACI|nr:DUF3900 domain-containing protein [Pontibacillus marinus]KGX91453.1 hypothetical protein N783_07810 [Pontibacillus marinus BH030004 = DSM 16465]